MCSAQAFYLSLVLESYSLSGILWYLFLSCWINCLFFTWTWPDSHCKTGQPGRSHFAQWVILFQKYLCVCCVRVQKHCNNCQHHRSWSCISAGKKNLSAANMWHCWTEHLRFLSPFCSFYSSTCISFSLIFQEVQGTHRELQKNCCISNFRDAAPRCDASRGILMGQLYYVIFSTCICSWRKSTDV